MVKRLHWKNNKDKNMRVVHVTTTLSLYIPKDWAKEFGIKKGDLIILHKQEKGIYLDISEGKKMQEEDTTHFIIR